jgi:type 1 glutamine amidotransferase
MRKNLPRILVLCGDRYHPASIARSGLSFMMEICDPVWVEDPHLWDGSSLDGFSAVVLAKSNHRSPVDHNEWTGRGIEQQLARFVELGGGLLAIHSGIAGYQGVPVMRRLLGGVFVGHPPECEVRLQPVGRHAILGDRPTAFSVWDEHYQVCLEASDTTVFLHSLSPAGVQPAGWTREHGSGRVCVLTPGHNQPVWLHPGYRQLVFAGLLWAAHGRGPIR